MIESMHHRRGKRVLGQVLPTLVTELEKLLRAAGDSELADQVSDLPLVARCRCGDDFCATLYMVPPPRGVSQCARVIAG